MNRILLIEDDRAFLKMLERILYRNNYYTESLMSGIGLFEKVLCFNPHLVLTDARMPDRDGRRVIKDMRQYFPQIPVILLTGSLSVYSNDPYKQANEFNVNAVLAKPFKTETLLKTIEECLDK